MKVQIVVESFLQTLLPLFRLESNSMFLEYLCLSFNLPLSPLLKYTADKPLNAFLPLLPLLQCSLPPTAAF